MHILNMRSQLLKESIDVYIKQRWWCFSLYENNFAWCCVIYKSRTYLGVSVWDAGWWSSLLLVCVLSFLPLTLSLSPPAPPLSGTVYCTGCSESLLWHHWLAVLSFKASAIQPTVTHLLSALGPTHTMNHSWVSANMRLRLAVLQLPGFESRVWRRKRMWC